MHTRIAIVCHAKSWMGLPRLFSPMARQGCEVHLLSGADTLAASSSYVTRHHVINDISDHALWHEAMLAIQPDRIIPGDDFVVDWLLQTEEMDEQVQALVEKSVGRLDQLKLARDKYQLAQLAKELNVPVPRDIEITENTDIGSVIHQLGLPLVIKGGLSTAGEAVHVCSSLREIRRARSELKKQQRSFAQPYVTGTPLMIPVACHNGEVLSGFCAYKRAVCPPITGPSAIVEITNHPKAMRYVEALVQELGLSGLISFDFVEDAEGECWLMECNLRPVPVSHLGELVESWLSTRKSGGSEFAPRRIALYPQAKLASLKAGDLEGAALDIPHDDAGLLRSIECIVEDYEQKLKEFA